MIAFVGFYVMKKPEVKDKLLYISIEIGALNISVSAMTIASVIFAWKQT